MKKIIYFFLLFFISNIIILPAQDALLLDNTVRSDFNRFHWVNYERFDYQTDDDGRVTDKIFFVFGEDEWEEQYKWEYVFDQDGNKTDMIEYVMGSEEWVPYKKTSRLYYPDGNLSEKTSYSYHNDDWLPTYQSLYNYDENGNMIDEIQRQRTGSEWVNYKRVSKEYSGSQKILKETYKNWVSDKWVNESMTEFTYNDSDILINTLSSIWEEMSWRSVNKEDYEYNEKDLLKKKDIYTIDSNEEWFLVDKIINDYYPNDSLKEVYYERYNASEDKYDIHKTRHLYLPEENSKIEILMYVSKNQWVLNQKKVFVRNDNGYLLADENYEWNENRWLDNWKRMFEYDENDHLVRENSYMYERAGYGKSDSSKNHYKTGGFLDRKEFFRWENSEWKKYKENLYTYNEEEISEEVLTNFMNNGNITHTIAQRFEYDDETRLSQEKVLKKENGVWTDSLKTVYSYEDGNLEKFTKLMWDGTKWDYVSRTLYVYDENELLSYKKQQYYLGNDKWQDDTFNYYYYDDDGKLREILSEYNDRPGFQTKAEYSYNEDELLTEIKHSQKYDEWTLKRTVTFEYDTNNNLVKEIARNKGGQIYKQIDYNYDWISDVEEFDDMNNFFQVFPNPFDDQLTVRFNLENGTNVSVGLFDAEGKPVVMPVRSYYSFGEHNVTLNTQFITSGSYYVVIEIDGEKFTKKVTNLR